MARMKIEEIEAALKLRKNRKEKDVLLAVKKLLKELKNQRS